VRWEFCRRQLDGRAAILKVIRDAEERPFTVSKSPAEPPAPTPWRRVVDWFIDNSFLLVLGAAGGLLWANVAFSSYDRFAHALHFAVNDIGMVFFFAIAAKEVFEATLPGGPLSSVRRAAVPLLAAAGGMLAPALIYIGLVAWSGDRELTRGWAIPCATDIAFSYLIARFIFGKTHPAVPFLLLLAIADDALGLIILAMFYPAAPLQPIAFALLLGAGLAVAWTLRRRRVASFWPYVLVAGPLSWAGFYVGGFHPALALVPIVPFIPHAQSDSGLFDEEDDRRIDALNRFEHTMKAPVQVVLLFFGLVNAGVPLAGVGPGTWIVLAAILAGKPLGVMVFVGLALAAGLKRPSGLGWDDLAVVGCVAGIGFTVALFFTTAAFPPGPLLDQTKMGALFSFAAAGVTLVAARLLRVGRFHGKPVN
jgi:NhaA family Na+:H+ antiporter